MYIVTTFRMCKALSTVHLKQLYGSRNAVFPSSLPFAAPWSRGAWLYEGLIGWPVGVLTLSYSEGSFSKYLFLSCW